MKTIISHPFKNENPQRQHPSFQGEAFDFDPHASDADIWIVHEDLPFNSPKSVNCRAAVLITSEPPMQRRYPAKYWKQFDMVITAQPAKAGVRVMHWQQCYPWHVGWDKNKGSATGNAGSSYVTLAHSPIPRKEKLLSVICSAEARLPGHRQRLKFVRLLKDKLGQKMDWFGRGINPLADKWDGLAPYHYHLCMENSVVSHYWTEKISDAFLACCMPIYWGAPNIVDYFDSRGLEVIDLRNTDESLARIENIILTPPKERNFDAILENRRRVMEEFNYLGLVQRISSNLKLGEKKLKKINPLSRYRGKSWIMMERIMRLPSRMTPFTGKL